MLYSAPAFIDMVRARFPEQTLQANFTDEQMKQLVSRTLKLMTKKDGSLMATLVDPKTNQIVSNVSLKRVNLSPNILQTITNYSTQMQLAQISEQIQGLQLGIEEVRQGQENDRLAMAYSCQQKLLQAMQMNDPQQRKMLY